MTVTLSFDRKAVEITWDTSVVEGATATVLATNPDTGDESSRGEVTNDGRCTLTFPFDYHGTADVVVQGSDGGTDSGTITV